MLLHHAEPNHHKSNLQKLYLAEQAGFFGHFAYLAAHFVIPSQSEESSAMWMLRFVQLDKSGGVILNA